MTTISTQKIKELVSQKVICFQMAAVTEKLALELSGNEFKLYFVLQNLVKFDADFCGEFSLSLLTSKTNMGQRTVQRALKTLEEKNLLMIKRSKNLCDQNNVNKIQVTLPQSWKAELEAAPDRTRKGEGLGQNDHRGMAKLATGLGQNDQEYINKNINIKTEIQKRKIDCSAVIETEFNSELTKLNERLEHFTQRRDEANQKITAAVKSNNFSHSKKLLDEHAAADNICRRILLDIAALKKNTQNAAQEPQQEHQTTKPIQTVTPRMKSYISRRLSAIGKISNPPQVLSEIIFAIENGQLKGSDALHSANAALKMVKGEVWRKPYLV